MPRRGLTTDEVVAEAARLAAEEGLGALSIRELAGRLNVKPASLYNHIKGADDLNARLGALALAQLGEALHAPSDSPAGDPAHAIRSLGHAYRSFAKANPELYKAIILAPRGNDLVWDAERELLDDIERAVEPRISDARRRLDFVRALRSSLHGFVSLEEAGFFARPGSPADESFDAMLDGFIRALDTASATGPTSTSMTTT